MADALGGTQVLSDAGLQDAARNAGEADCDAVESLTGNGRSLAEAVSMMTDGDPDPTQRRELIDAALRHVCPGIT